MNQFEVLKELGCGSFGRVVKVRKHKQHSEVYAMKQIKMMQLSPRQKDNALNEIRLLASINSPNIISYKTAFFEQLGSTLCIIMEYANGGDLAAVIKKKIEKCQKIKENFIWSMAFNILNGLKILHANQIVHRDIKPANIFLVDGTAKIGDMNVSKVLIDKYTSTQTGTPYYTSPQIWNNAKYDERVDIWALGCLIYELAVLRPPFMAKDFSALSRKVILGYYEPIPAAYSRKLAELIRKCLTLKMSDRPTAQQLLKDPMFVEMEHQDFGQIELLDTIRCPKMLKMLPDILPDSKSTKKLVSMKDIDRSQSKQHKQVQPKSMKKIASNKHIHLPSAKALKQIKQQKENEKMGDKIKLAIQPSNECVKLPRICSQKNIVF